MNIDILLSLLYALFQSLECCSVFLTEVQLPVLSTHIGRACRITKGTTRQLGRTVAVFCTDMGGLTLVQVVKGWIPVSNRRVQGSVTEPWVAHSVRQCPQLGDPNFLIRWFFASQGGATNALIPQALTQGSSQGIHEAWGIQSEGCREIPSLRTLYSWLLSREEMLN